MKISKAYTGQISGLTMEKITVEVDISNGLNSFSIVGLGDRSVEEAKDRVAAAIKNTGYVSPKQKNQKVVISLAPADIRKEGTSFDLAMAVAYLAGAGDIEFEYEDKIFLGELSLDGQIRKVHGILPILIQAREQCFTTAFIPKENLEEATLARDIIVYAVSSLRELVEHILHIQKIPQVRAPEETCSPTEIIYENDISYIRGNETAKRALEVAAAGCHNIILYGPPGTGKTMLAQSLVSIMPPLSYEQSIEVTSIHSIARTLPKGLIKAPPFRSPHHSASPISILGGGQNHHPGEITLAHRGVLFFDECQEFDSKVLESLRQPLEDKVITVSRAKGSVTFPAQCIFIASMNPCRCGKEIGKGCSCTPKSIETYQRRISGPILDRIDIWINVNKVDYEKLAAISEENISDTRRSTYESSSNIRKRIIKARKIQEDRFAKDKYFNSEMKAKDIDKYALLTEEARTILKISAERMHFSGRAFHKVIKVARTIADLEASEYIKKNHMLEALQYRQKIF